MIQSKVYLLSTVNRSSLKLKNILQSIIFYAINTDSIKIFSNLPSNNSLSNLCQKEMLDDLPLNISNIRAVSRNGNYILLSEPSILNIYNTDLRNYQYSVPN